MRIMFASKNKAANYLSARGKLCLKNIFVGFVLKEKGFVVYLLKYKFSNESIIL